MDVTWMVKIENGTKKDLTNMLLERNEEIMYFTGIVGGQLPRLHVQFGGDGWDESSAVDKTYLPTWKRPEKLILMRAFLESLTVWIY